LLLIEAIRDLVENFMRQKPPAELPEKCPAAQGTIIKRALAHIA
jgi:hypothetical protein